MSSMTTEARNIAGEDNAAIRVEPWGSHVRMFATAGGTTVEIQFSEVEAARLESWLTEWGEQRAAERG